MQLGDVIASFRKKKNVDQKELAGALGITVTYLSLIENNRRMPSPPLLRSIANYFGVKMTVFLFPILKSAGVKSKKSQETLKAAEPFIIELLDIVISDKDTKGSAKTTKGTVKKPRK